MADTGITYPGTATTEAVNPEDDKDWTDINNIKTEAPYAYALNLPSHNYSYRIKATNFGFSLPAGATIDGILVEIKRFANYTNSITDYRVQLLDADGALVGDNKADTVSYWPTSGATVSYGGATDTWNASPTEAMVEDADFGVILSVYNGAAANRTPGVYFIRITVYYTAAGETYTKTVNITALLKETDTKTVVLDTLLSIADTKTVSLDALIRELGILKTVALDALLLQAGTETVDLDTLLRGIVDKTVDLDTLLQKVGDAKTVDLDALIALVKLTQIVTIDTLLEKTDSKTIDLDTYLRALNVLQTVDLDTFIQAVGLTKTVAIDVLLATIMTETIDLDALLRALGVTKTVALDALLKGVGSKTIDLDVLLAKLGTVTIQLDVILRAYPSGVLGYSIEIRDSSGNLLAVLENAYGINFVEQLNRPPMLDFSLPANDSKISHIDPANEIWLRDYETGVLVKKFLISRRNDTRR